MKKLLTLALLAVAPVCFGQGFGTGMNSPIQLTTPISLATTTSTLTYTNGVLDLHDYVGLATVVFSWTNSVSTVGSPTLGVSLLGASTSTGLMAPYANAALMTSNSVTITNLISGNVGTNVTWTNTAAFSSACSNQVTSGSGFVIFQWPISDGPRYLSDRFDINTGTNTYIVSAIMFARKRDQ